MTDAKNTEDEELISKQTKDRKSAEAEMFQALSSFLKTKGGRRFAWEVHQACRVMATSFTGNSKTFFNEGERNVGIFLFEQYFEEVDPDIISKIRKEFKNE